MRGKDRSDTIPMDTKNRVYMRVDNGTITVCVLPMEDD